MTTLLKQIEAAYEIEQKNPVKAISPADIPLSYELMTPEWLSHHLCSGIPGAKVVSFDLSLPDDGNTNRRRIFLEYNEAGTMASLPGSVFCKASQKLENRLSLAHVGLLHGEVIFSNISDRCWTSSTE